MARTKTRALTISTIAEVKELPEFAAERDHHSSASMVEVLVLDYARAYGLQTRGSVEPGAKKSAKAR